ncbi:MAG: metal ABC transporter substrate-binding protein [Coriobacteriales bacterium]|nr:metal ABC transporter substrate-binding protein [Coriobacteriales bacterium]
MKMRANFKLLLLALTLSIALALGGCGAGNGAGAASGSSGSNASGSSGAAATPALKVVTTVFAPYDFARQIGGAQVEASMLLPPGVESHGFEPTPRDLLSIQECDLFIYIGGESETWVSDVLDSLDLQKTRVLQLMDSVSLLEEEIVEGMEPEEEEEADHAAADAASADASGAASASAEADEHAAEGEEVAYDEHIWTSPENAKKMVKAISEALCALRPAEASQFQERTQAYLTQLDELDAALHETVAAGVRKTIVFGDRFPFRYLTDELGLSYYAAFPGCSSETEAKPATVAFLIDKVKAERLPVIFKIEMSNTDIAQTIAEETGAALRNLHSLHNLSESEVSSGATYLSIMWDNVAALKEALD